MHNISLRDYFAGCALTGILACHRVSGSDQEQAKAAYSVADAMIEVRGDKEEKVCEWTPQKKRGDYNAACGGKFCRIEEITGGVLEFRCCPECGGRIVVKGE